MREGGKGLPPLEETALKNLGGLKQHIAQVKACVRRPSGKIELPAVPV